MKLKLITGLLIGISAVSLYITLKTEPIKPPEYNSEQRIGEIEPIRDTVTNQVEVWSVRYDRNGDGIVDLELFLRKCNKKLLSGNPFAIYDYFSRTLYLDTNLNGTIDEVIQNPKNFSSYMPKCPTPV